MNWHPSQFAARIKTARYLTFTPAIPVHITRHIYFHNEQKQIRNVVPVKMKCAGHILHPCHAYSLYISNEECVIKLKGFNLTV